MTTKKTYGRYTSFGDWMFHTIAPNLVLLLAVTFMMGIYDSVFFVAGQWIKQFLDFQPI